MNNVAWTTVEVSRPVSLLARGVGPGVPVTPPLVDFLFLKWTTCNIKVVKRRKSEEVSILWPQRPRLESSLSKFVSHQSILNMTLY